LTQCIKQALQNDGGGHFINIGLAFFAAHSGFDHLLFGFETRKPFVPEDDGQGREIAEIAGEGSGGLAARAFAAVHVQRQAQDDEAHIFSGGEFDQGLRIGGEFGAPHRVARRCKLPGVIRRGHADGLGAKVQGHEAQVHGQGRNGGQGGVEQDGHWGAVNFFSRNRKQHNL
jgi:hypothetical protein